MHASRLSRFDPKWEKQLSSLYPYTNKINRMMKDFHVLFASTNTWMYDPMEHVVHGVIRSLGSTSFLYSFLHEMGHVVMINDPHLDYEAIYERKKNAKKSNTIRCIKEEFMAWEYGFYLAERYKLKIDRASYESYSHKFLHGYIFGVK